MGDRKRAAGSRAALGPKPFFGPRGGAAVLRAALRRGRPLIVFLDYDGTLAPIRSEPALARIAPRLREVLDRAARRPGIRLGIISGRFMEDLAEKVGPGRFFLAASHGLRIRLDGRTWIHPSARECPALMGRLGRTLRAALKEIPGVMVEDKGLTLSVHFRRAASGATARVRRALEDALRPYRGRLKLAPGKKVVEVMPEASWNKGEAALRIVRRLSLRPRPLVLYVGDDVTDESAFRALRASGGLTVRVGRSIRTAAEYSIGSQARVADVLELIGGSGPAGRRHGRA